MTPATIYRQTLARYDARTRLVAVFLLAIALAIVLVLAVLVLARHPHLPACSEAFVVGLGGHLLFDLVSYVAVFVFGVRARKWFPSCNHKHH